VCVPQYAKVCELDHATIGLELGEPGPAAKAGAQGRAVSPAPAGLEENPCLTGAVSSGLGVVPVECQYVARTEENKERRREAERDLQPEDSDDGEVRLREGGRGR